MYGVSVDKQMYFTGIVQIIIGGSCMIFGIVERITDERGTVTSAVGLAIWMGLLVSIDVTYST